MSFLNAPLRDWELCNLKESVYPTFDLIKYYQDRGGLTNEQQNNLEKAASALNEAIAALDLIVIDTDGIERKEDRFQAGE